MSLYKQTVDEKTFDILYDLMNDENLKDFFLVGGTALALQIGHRKSIDIDLFSQSSFDSSKMANYLLEKYNFSSTFVVPETTKGIINNIKVDLISYKYENIFPLVELGGIRMLDIRDISAMKLSAIADNETRMKDFVDIAFLSTKITLNDMIDCYVKKFPTSIASRPIRGLTFYDDILDLEPIELIKGKFKWKEIEKRLNAMLKNRDLLYDNDPVEVKKVRRIKL